MGTATHTGKTKLTRLFVEKMQREGVPLSAIDVFVNYYERLADGATATIPESEISPVNAASIKDLSHLGRYEAEGKSALAKTVVVKLNGGLGTTMGLHGPKSLIQVKNGLSFLDITIRQTRHLNEMMGIKIPFLLMNSFFTEAGTSDALSRIKDLQPDFVRSFLQHKFPRILATTLEPVSVPQKPSAEWNPAGHGDLLLSLHTSGLLEELLADGYRYLFVSNIDNLGAEIDEGILGYFAAEGLDFLMEVTDRTDMDRKGGHLARLKNGRLCLREAAQCAPHDAIAFSDTGRHPLFNTNNLWLSLEGIRRVVRENKCAELPFVVNRKKLLANDPAAPAVYHLESALGSALSLFEKSAALRVPRSRFAPVKTCDELLLLWSDAYVLLPDYRLRPDPSRKSARTSISLDPAYYSSIDLLQTHFPCGAPSLLDCESLSVKGDVRFGRNVSVRGVVSIINNTSRQAGIEDNATVTGKRVL